MKNLAFLFLIFTCVAHSTTKTAERPVRADGTSCDLRAKFLAARGVKLNGGPGRETRTENAVYWDLEPLDGSGSSCPKERAIAVRIRSAAFREKGSGLTITYPVDLAEPVRDQTIRIKTKFVQGRDTFLNLKFSEWILLEKFDD